MGIYRAFVFFLLALSATQLSASTTSEMLCTRAQLELRAKHYEQAIELLNKALADDWQYCPRDAKARYLRGVAYNRLGEGGEALPDLLAAEDAELDAPGLRRETGLAYYLVAREHLAAGEYIEALEAAEKAARYDGQLRDHIARLNREARKGLGEQRPWSLELSLGLAYDDNVGLYPDNRPLPPGVTTQEDGRLQLGLDARRRWEGEGRRWGLGYRLFQSRHQELDSFNLQNHTLSGDLRVEHALFGQSGEWGLNLQLIHASLGGETYEQGAALSPLLLIGHDGAISFFKLLWRQDRFPYAGLEGYDGRRLEGLYRYYLTDTDESYSYAGLRARHDRSDDAALGYHGLTLELGARRPWHGIEVRGDLGLERRIYDAHTDSYGEFSLSFGYRLQQGWLLEAGMSHLQNRSDDATLDYSRNNYFFTSRWQL